MTKCRYNRNTELSIRGGPMGTRWCRIIVSPEYSQSIKYVTLLKNLRTPWEDIGKALHIAMAWTQYSIVVPYRILSNTSQDVSYVKENFSKDATGNSIFIQYTSNINSKKTMYRLWIESTHKPYTKWISTKIKDQLCQNYFYEYKM